MFNIGSSQTDMIMIIEVLEVLLLVQSIALIVQSERKIVKIVNALTAVFWLVAIIMNAINYALILE